MLYGAPACKDVKATASNTARVSNAEIRLAHEHLTYEDLLRIVQLIKSAEQFSEFRLKVGDIEVELRRRRPGASASASSSPAAAESGSENIPIANPREAATTLAPPSEPATWQDGTVLVRAPMIGTFYHAPSPGAAPFVQVGQTVEPDTVVCIIEVMKLMNSITAGVNGTVVQILVNDEASVEAEQPLIVLRPR